MIYNFEPDTHVSVIPAETGLAYLCPSVWMEDGKVQYQLNRYPVVAWAVKCTVAAENEYHTQRFCEPVLIHGFDYADYESECFDALGVHGCLELPNGDLAVEGVVVMHVDAITKSRIRELAIARFEEKQKVVAK